MKGADTGGVCRRCPHLMYGMVYELRFANDGVMSDGIGICGIGEKCVILGA